MKINDLAKTVFSKFNYTHLFLLIMGVAVGFFHDSIQAELKKYSEPSKSDE